MIAYLHSLPIGNAVRCLLAPSEGAVLTRVLRKLTDDIANEADPAAAVAYEGDETYFVDTTALNNGTSYFYRAFDQLADNSWVASPSVSVTPLATGNLGGPDAQTLVRERVAAALKAEVAAGRLRHDTGAIPVLTAPPLFESTKWPVVSIHMRSEAPQHRGLGEVVTSDVFDTPADNWIESEGWLASVALEIVGWSLNPDERIMLRKAIKKAIVGNLPVLAAKGLSEIAISQADAEDPESYNAPVYWTSCTFTCIAPVIVSDRVDDIEDVEVEAFAIA